MSDATFKDASIATPQLSLKGVREWGRVVDILDGDTIHVVLPFLGQQFKFIIRLAGIDTCEMKSKNPDNKARAIAARDRIFELVTGQQSSSITATATGKTRKEIQQRLSDNSKMAMVYVSCDGADKYGRVLADVFASDLENEVSFSDILVREKLAYVYNGESKPTEELQLKMLG